MLNAFAKVKSKDIDFPGKYYTKEIKSCSAIPKNNKLEMQILAPRAGLEPATN